MAGLCNDATHFVCIGDERCPVRVWAATVCRALYCLSYFEPLQNICIIRLALFGSNPMQYHLYCCTQAHIGRIFVVACAFSSPVDLVGNGFRHLIRIVNFCWFTTMIRLQQCLL